MGLYTKRPSRKNLILKMACRAHFIWAMRVKGQIFQQANQTAILKIPPLAVLYLALAKGNLWVSSGPMGRHNCHGISISTHPSPVIALLRIKRQHY